MNESETTKPGKRVRWWKLFLILLGIAVVVVFGGRVWWRYKYPYGYSHACSKSLSVALRTYSDDYRGWLPSGKANPETSLSLLYQHDPTAAYVLGGKNVPTKVVEAELAKESLLKPESCGWHYIEGLREDDDPRIAVAWDKVVGLGHNGARRRGLMHEVVFLDGSVRFVTKAEWPQFVAEQKELLAGVIASRESNAPPIRWSDEATLGPNRFSPLTGSRPRTNTVEQ